MKKTQLELEIHFLFLVDLPLELHPELVIKKYIVFTSFFTFCYFTFQLLECDHCPS